MKKSFNVSGFSTSKWPQIVAGLSAAGGAFAVGVALGWPASMAPRLVAGDEKYFSITPGEMDWAASIITLGCAISCLPIGFLMKKLGRKGTMLSLVLPFMIGWGLVTFAKNFEMLLIGRFVIGLAGGAFCVSAPQYSAEIAEKDIRGVLGTFFQLLIIFGILFAYIVGSFSSVFSTNIICGLVPLVFGAIFLCMPESPVFLMADKREEDAIKSLKWLRGSLYDPKNEIEDLKKDLAESQASGAPISEVLKRKLTIKTLFIGFGLMFFQQLSGINAVIFYSTTIFNAADTSLDSNISTIIVGVVHLIATFIGSLLVDKAGRKILLLISIVMMTLSLTSLGAFFYISDVAPNAAKSLGWLPLASLCLYLVFFAIGFGPVPWLMLSEIYSKEYNSVASPITGCFNWSLAFVITVTFGSISASWGIGQTFWIFAAFGVLGTIFTFIYVPETKGKSVSEIQKILGGENSSDEIK